MTNYRIRIEEVVLHGIAAGSRGAFSDALQRELESAVHEALALRGIADGAIQSQRLEQMIGPPIRLAETTSGRTLASDAAQSIAAALPLHGSETTTPLGSGGHNGD